MEILNTILNWFKVLLVPVVGLFAYFSGKNQAERKRLKDENEKLKKYQDIDNIEHSSDDAFNAGLW